MIAEAETAPIEAAATLEKIGRFEVRSWLGAGAFGDVYRAYDPQLDREVALKVAKPGTLDTPERVQRFLREAKSAANLRHPNIVPVFDSGLDGARHYIASGFIDGRTLEAVIEESKDKGQPLAIDEAARIVRKLATALGYANSRGVVHRDVKPANVMMDETGEPLLIDFGLAGQANHSVGAGSVSDGSEPERIGAGTPAYMAPEQATGSEGPAADQYSLGCTLYELVTGQTPFAGGAVQQVFLHANQPIPSPRTVRPEISRDLEAVILKCVAKEPAQRYANCEALAEDLRRYLDREPVTARRIGSAERLTKWTKRNPLVAGSLTAAVLALVIGTGVSLWQAGEARTAAKNEVEQRRIADEKADAATNAEAATATQLVLTQKAKVSEEAERKLAQQQEALARRTKDYFIRDVLNLHLEKMTSQEKAPPKLTNQFNPNESLAVVVLRASKNIESAFLDDPLVEAEVRRDIAMMLRLFQKDRLANLQLEKAYAIYTNSLGHDSKEAIGVLEDLCMYLEFYISQNHPMAAIVGTCLEIANVEKANSYYRSLYNHYLTKQTTDKLLDATLMLAYSCVVSGLDSEAFELCEMATKLLAKIIGPSSEASLSIAESHFQIGRIHQKLNKSESAIACLQRARQFYSSAIASANAMADPKSASMLKNNLFETDLEISKCMYRIGKYVEAATILDSLMMIAERAPSTQLAEIQYILGACYSRNNELKKSIQLLESAIGPFANGTASVPISLDPRCTALEHADEMLGKNYFAIGDYLKSHLSFKKLHVYSDDQVRAKRELPPNFGKTDDLCWMAREFRLINRPIESYTLSGFAIRIVLSNLLKTFPHAGFH